ncbi:FGFR1 oncogene partner 2 homolog [Tachypleus tridentatus]|uniref:FGFR1 oncogene partner 2 homolog n=1 Tax=Tachypleus tridentatus TaxID=6853 RepID=UPI003FD4E7C0
MSVTVQQILGDAKRLVTRLREHDNSADNLIGQTETLSKHIESMKQYSDGLADLNAAACHRPRSALILNIQQENRHIRELQQENRELRSMLEEHQSALELIMNKYREQVARLAQTSKDEEDCIKQNNCQDLQQKIEKIFEMVAVMKKAIEIDDSNITKEHEQLDQLVKENHLLRELLEIRKSVSIMNGGFSSENMCDIEIQTES